METKYAKGSWIAMVVWLYRYLTNNRKLKMMSNLHLKWTSEASILVICNPNLLQFVPNKTNEIVTYLLMLTTQRTNVNMYALNNNKTIKPHRITLNNTGQFLFTERTKIHLSSFASNGHESSCLFMRPLTSASRQDKYLYSVPLILLILTENLRRIIWT